MSGRSGVNDRHRDFAFIPILDILAGGNFAYIKPLLDPLQVVLKPVGYQHRLAICGFNQVLQSVQFPVVEFDVFLVLAIYGTIGHLGELTGQGRCCSGIDFFALQGYH